MEGSALISEIIEILTGGIVGVSSAVGTGLSTLAQDIFFATGEGATGLSVLGTCIVVFAGISLALGLCRWVLNFFTSLGARDR
jgi:hypothetical protein